MKPRMLPMVRCILLLTSIMSSTLSPYSATALRLGTLFRRSNLPSSPSSLSSPSSPASRPSSPRLDAVTVPIVSPTTTGVTTHNQRQHPQHVKEQQLPPEDGTFSFVETLRELWTGPGLSKARQVRYDNMVRSSGGVWRSRLLGLFPHVVLSAPSKTSWLTQQEARGKVMMGVPKSMELLLGEKSPAVLERGCPMDFDKVKRIMNEALSSESVVAMQPLIQHVVDKYTASWHQSAKEQKEVVFMHDAVACTLEIITTALLGDAAPGALDDLMRLIPAFTSSLVSVPARLPWPLSRIQIFSYGRGVDNRKNIMEVLLRAMEERRAAIAANGGIISRSDGPVCVMDRFLYEQAKQRECGEADGKHGIVFDDGLICDNLIVLLWAGHESSAIALSRILQLLGSPEGHGAQDILRQELSSTKVTAKHHPRGSKASSALTGPGKGLFENFPVLASIFAETSRMFPVVPCTFRMAVEDLHIDGYTIPAGNRVAWAPMTTYRSEDLYSSPSSFCPFRFLHGGGKSSSVSEATKGGRDGFAASSAHHGLVGGEQAGSGDKAPLPPVFGFGKHMCPGRELTKLEIIIVLKRLLHEFDFELVGGQSFKEVLPLNAPKDGMRLLLSSRKTTTSKTMASESSRSPIFVKEMALAGRS